jgi:hypothetical protein
VFLKERLASLEGRELANLTIPSPSPPICGTQIFDERKQ